MPAMSDPLGARLAGPDEAYMAEEHLSPKEATVKSMTQIQGALVGRAVGGLFDRHGRATRLRVLAAQDDGQRRGEGEGRAVGDRVLEVDSETPVAYRRVTLRCGEVALTEAIMGHIGNHVSVRVTRPLNPPKVTMAAFEALDEKVEQK